MYRLSIIGFLLLFISGCVTDDQPGDGFTIDGSRSSDTLIHYQGEIARQVHPLTFFIIPESLPLSQVDPVVDSDLSGYLPKHVIRRNPDILFSLHDLESHYPDLDLNEPVSQRFVVAFIEDEPYTSMITLSPERYFHIQLDNDIFNYTDRFYTNGIRLSFISPALRNNPVGKLLIPYWHRGINYYSLSLVQDMYTPSTTKIGGIIEGDRPYAAYLYIGTSKLTNDARHKVRLSSEIQIGIIGPSSLGEYVQRTFHNAVPTNNEPLGWEFQIQDDLLLNYVAKVEKGIVSVPGLDLLIHGSGTLGTVYTNIGGGAYVRSGWFNSYFMNLFFSKRSLNRFRNARNIQFYFFADVAGKAVGYDATLQGGLFNRSSPYTISAKNINRLMFAGSAGIVFSFGGFQLKGEQFLLSPEFKNGWWHKWLSVGLSFSF
ncbi:MAG: lipid A deacylase LpxR family protein [Bacteroidia bacterium]|nr:lipid A deacylase LpxR family protein [Bacteroidia bacterium]